MSTEPEVRAALEEAVEEKSDRSTLRVIGWFSVGMVVATVGIFLGKELFSRYSSTGGHRMTSTRTPMSNRWASSAWGSKAQKIEINRKGIRDCGCLFCLPFGQRRGGRLAYWPIGA